MKQSVELNLKMDKKTLSIILSIFLLVVLATAQILESLRPAQFVVPEYKPVKRYSGCIDFTYNNRKGTGQVCLHGELSMDIDDDFEEELQKHYPNIRFTEKDVIRDWTGRTYQEVTINGTVHRSFNESKLNDLLEVQKI